MVCKKCSKDKLQTDFFRDKKMASGFRSECKECHMIFIKEWRTKNDYHNKYAKLNIDKKRASDKRYYSLNKERVAESKKKTYLKYNYKETRPRLPKEKMAELQKKYRSDLNDSYIRDLLKESGIDNPTNEMILERKMSVKIKRIINEKSRTINTQGNNGRVDNVLQGIDSK